MQFRAPRETGCGSRCWVVVTRILFLTLMLGACGSSSEPDTTEAQRAHPTLSEVIDGDTVIVRFPNGREEAVRLLGIDTPETVDPTRPVQCFGREAAEHLGTLVPPGTPLTLERDLEARDRFGRLLAYIYRSSDGLFINAEMLRLGFADLSIFEPNTAHQPAFVAAVTTARTSSVGLWDACGGPDVPLDPHEYD